MPRPFSHQLKHQVGVFHGAYCETQELHKAPYREWLISPLPKPESRPLPPSFIFPFKFLTSFSGPFVVLTFT